MDIKTLKEKWENFGKSDPLFGILAYKGKEVGGWDFESFFETGKAEVDDVFRYLERMNYAPRKGTALDFGCGIGRISQALAGRFDRVHGVDISESMIELAKKRNRFGEKCEYHVISSDNLGIFGDECFDFVYTVRTLQHIPKEFAVNYIREFVRILKKDGLLIFHIPSHEFPRIVKISKAIQRLDFRSAVTKVTPEFVLEGYHRMVHDGESRPKADMFGIPRDEIIPLVGGCGAKVIDIMENDFSGPDWESFQYSVKKL